jgi:hypothetical protein
MDLVSCIGSGRAYKHISWRWFTPTECTRFHSYLPANRFATLGREDRERTSLSRKSDYISSVATINIADPIPQQLNVLTVATTAPSPSHIHQDSLTSIPSENVFLASINFLNQPSHTPTIGTYSIEADFQGETASDGA